MAGQAPKGLALGETSGDMADEGNPAAAIARRRFPRRLRKHTRFMQSTEVAFREPESTTREATCRTDAQQNRTPRMENSGHSSNC